SCIIETKAIDLVFGHQFSGERSLVATSFGIARIDVSAPCAFIEKRPRWIALEQDVGSALTAFRGNAKNWINLQTFFMGALQNLFHVRALLDQLFGCNLAVPINRVALSGAMDKVDASSLDPLHRLA